MNASDRYQVDDACCMLEGQTLPVANVSVGGLFAVSERPPRPGQILSFGLALSEREPLQVRGQVAWVNGEERRAKLPGGFGIKITQISFVDKIALLGYLRRNESAGVLFRRSQPSLS